MEDARECRGEGSLGVLNHLMELEMGALAFSRQQQENLRQQKRVDDLRIIVEELRAKRDELKARAKATMGVADQGTEEFDEDDRSQTAPSELSFLMARKTQVKELLQAHHLIGGYDVTETSCGKGVCISIATAFEGLYLETYNIELDVSRPVRIRRHNVPPFVPLEKLAQEHLQTDLPGFLSTLNSHLNAYVGRRQQVRLIQEVLRGSVEVMEGNVLFNIVVLMCTASGENGRALLCTLEYSDLSRYLPTKVTIESEDKALPSTPQWKENQALLLSTPAHTAFQALKTRGHIK